MEAPKNPQKIHDYPNQLKLFLVFFMCFQTFFGEAEGHLDPHVFLLIWTFPAAKQSPNISPG